MVLHVNNVDKSILRTLSGRMSEMAIYKMKKIKISKSEFIDNIYGDASMYFRNLVTEAYSPLISNGVTIEINEDQLYNVYDAYVVKTMN